MSFENSLRGLEAFVSLHATLGFWHYTRFWHQTRFRFCYDTLDFDIKHDICFWRHKKFWRQTWLLHFDDTRGFDVILGFGFLPLYVVLTSNNIGFLKGVTSKMTSFYYDAHGFDVIYGFGVLRYTFLKRQIRLQIYTIRVFFITEHDLELLSSNTTLSIWRYKSFWSQ